MFEKCQTFKKMDKKRLLEKIRIQRITLGYSQQYMSQMLKISQSQYSRLESGVNEISEEQVVQIFKIFNFRIA